MPILPIDLQILFSQMNQVGKEQSVQKEGAQIQASMQQMGIAKQTEQKNNSVNETHDVGDEVVNLKNEAKNRQEQAQEKKKRHEKEAKKSKKFFQDPALGHNIDIES